VGFRIQVVRHLNAREEPVPLSGEIRLSHPQGQVSASFVTSEDGVAVFNHVGAFGAEAPRIDVSAQGQLLAQGKWRPEMNASVREVLTPVEVQGVPSRMGASSGLSVGLSLLDGPLAVPFESAIRLSIRDSGGPRVGLELGVQVEGAEFVPTAHEAGLRLATDSAGNADFQLRALEHSVRVRLTKAVPSAGNEETWVFTLPVVPGAIVARLEGGLLRVRSPVPRSVAHLNIIDSERTLLAARVPLVPAATGSEGVLSLGDLVGPVWAMTSSEHDMKSMAVVGWPIAAPEGRAALVRPDRVVVDGVAQALTAQRHDQERIRTAASGFALFALLAELGLLLRLRAVHGTQPAGASGLPKRGIRWTSEGATLWLVVFGFALLAAWVLVRG
jgi:hypothetical protein